MSDNVKKLLNNSYIELSVRWSLGMIFVYACYHKIIAPAHFAKIIYGYIVLIINGMLMMFILALSINLVRGSQFDCGCFSSGEAGYTYSAGQLLIRDIVFFVCGLQVLFFRKRRKLCLRQTGNILTGNVL